MSILASLVKVNKTKTALQKMADKDVKKMLQSMALVIIENEAAILKANQKDLAAKDPNDPKNDRLMLNRQRLKSISNAIKNISRLPDPTGVVLTERKLPNGINLKKVAVPLGVVGAIYESRPNDFSVKKLIPRWSLLIPV